ncbi:MAG: hypothetical protein AB7O96_18215 [Pseudobdellovibrionaceae bacterium]
MKKALTYEQIMQLEEVDEVKINLPVLFCDGLSPNQVLTAMQKTGAEHIIQQSNINYDTEIQVPAVMQSRTQVFSQFPLCSIFGYQNADEKQEQRLTELSFLISDVEEKRNLLNAIESYVSSISASRSFATNVVFVADELMTNALYNAPFVGERDSTWGGFPRNHESIVLDPQKRPHIFLGRDQGRLILGCRDFYGSLDIKKYISRIHECYSLDADQALRHGAGGAGVGAYMVFNSCTSVYLAVQKGESTLVCCSFPYGVSEKQTETMAKNIHCLEKNNS